MILHNNINYKLKLLKNVIVSVYGVTYWVEHLQENNCGYMHDNMEWGVMSECHNILGENVYRCSPTMQSMQQCDWILNSQK